jgi:CHAD domain-containing protein
MTQATPLIARARQRAPSSTARARQRALRRKARDLELPRRASVREAAHAAIAEGRAHFLHNAHGLLHAHDPELVHQTRVALRRLRVFVRVFRSRIGRERAARLVEELRWLFEPLGELRDLQIFEREFAPRSSARSAGSAAFAARLGQRLEAAQSVLANALASPRFRALCEELAGVEHALAADGQDERARRWLARRLDRRRRRALRSFEAVLRRDMRALHKLRKELKKLRYTAELARALRPSHEQQARAFLRALRELQDALGAVVDASVARSLLASLRAPQALRASMSRRIARRTAPRLAELDPRLQRFADLPPFWH